MTRNYWSRLALSSFLAMVLSYFALVFLAALPIRYTRLTFGRKTFVVTTAASIAMLAAIEVWPIAIVYASLCLLIGLYRELEERHVSIFLASTISVILTAGLNLLALLGYTRWFGYNISSFIAEKSKPLLDQMRQLPSFEESMVENLLWYLPSSIVITMMLILFVSLTVSRTPASRRQSFEMRMFRLPDWLIWVFIASLGLKYIQLGLPWLSLVATNVLVIALAGYFFQGLAVFTFFLDRLSIFGFWRLLAYFLVFFQLFPFVSGLGILDYWFDFRLHGIKESKLKNEKNNEEY